MVRRSDLTTRCLTTSRSSRSARLFVESTYSYFMNVNRLCPALRTFATCLVISGYLS